MNPASAVPDDRRAILGIIACMLLVIASFLPWWMYVRYGSSMLAAGAAMLGPSGTNSDWALAAWPALALALLSARRRWALMAPSRYGAIAFLWVVAAWALSADPFMRRFASSYPPIPAERLGLSPPQGPVLSPYLILLVLGAVLGIAVSWCDFRAAIRVAAGRG